MMSYQRFDICVATSNKVGPHENISPADACTLWESPISLLKERTRSWIPNVCGVCTRGSKDVIFLLLYAVDPGFEGHALPGTLFLVIGLWHVWSTLVRYVSDPKSFRVRVWNPVPGHDGRIKNLELYVIAVGSFVDICFKLLYSPHFQYFVNGVLNPVHMNDFKHSGMLLMFFIFGLISLLPQETRFLPLPEGALCLIAAAAFSAEYLLFYFHSTTHKGLEGYYHIILVLLVGLCILSTVTGALLPTSFPVDLCSGIALTLQGIWFYQTTFTLYGPMMPYTDFIDLNVGMRYANILYPYHYVFSSNRSIIPEYVFKTLSDRNSEVRGELLANFQIFSIVLGVLVAVVVTYGFVNSRFGYPELKLVHGAQNVFVDDQISGF